jgi:hypothetical protein
MFSGDGLAEADIPLSATRLSGMAATISPILQLKPVVAQQQPDFFGTGLRALQIAKKSPGAGSLFLTHGLSSCRLAPSLNIFCVEGGHVQFHALIMLLLGSLLGILHCVQGAQPFIAGAILPLQK